MESVQLFTNCKVTNSFLICTKESFQNCKEVWKLIVFLVRVLVCHLGGAGHVGKVCLHVVGIHNKRKPLRISACFNLGWIVGLEPTTFRTTI